MGWQNPASAGERQSAQTVHQHRPQPPTGSGSKTSHFLGISLALNHFPLIELFLWSHAPFIRFLPMVTSHKGRSSIPTACCVPRDRDFLHRQPLGCVFIATRTRLPNSWAPLISPAFLSSVFWRNEPSVRDLWGSILHNTSTPAAPSVSDLWDWFLSPA